MFGLGTVQLGLPYGVANKRGMPTTETSLNLLMLAWEKGIRKFDTAAAYGTSEQLLGRFFQHLGKGEKSELRVTTKLGDVRGKSSSTIREMIFDSCQRMRLERIDSVLLHNEEEADELNGEVGIGLNSLLDEGIIGKVGVSVYSPKLALDLMSVNGVSEIQIPTNALDFRWENVYKAARLRGVSLSVRSAYLQGLLLLPADEAPEVVPGARGVLRNWEDFCCRRGVTKAVMALGYVNHACPDGVILLGCETEDQLLENFSNFEASQHLNEEHFRIWEKVCPPMDQRLVNPADWALHSDETNNSQR